MALQDIKPSSLSSELAIRTSGKSDVRSATSCLCPARKREKELAKPGALERLEAPDPTLTAVIDRYIDESIKKIGRTKAQVLRAIKNYDIANKRCSEITSTDVVAFANESERSTCSNLVYRLQ
jgi:hypothetical protein